MEHTSNEHKRQSGQKHNSLPVFFFRCGRRPVSLSLNPNKQVHTNPIQSVSVIGIKQKTPVLSDQTAMDVDMVEFVLFINIVCELYSS